MLQRIVQLLRLDRNRSARWKIDLERIVAGADMHLRRKPEQGRGLKVLFANSFSIYDPSYVHDTLLATALRLRGAHIVPVICDRVQTKECNVHGGVWGGGDAFLLNCRRCFARSAELWRHLDGGALRLSEYIYGADRQAIDEQIQGLSEAALPSFEEDGLPIGRWAQDILVNNYVVGDRRLIPQHEELGRAHLRNLMLLRRAYDRILESERPDRVVANDSYYGMWALWQHLSHRRGVPFYSQWSGTRTDSWCYAYNDAAMNLDFTKPWPTFSRRRLTEVQQKKIDDWLGSRMAGKGMILDTASLASFKDVPADMTSIDRARPVALLLTNVIWDLAALNKQVVFADMIEWVRETIAWFGRHPEFQLIIKPHPAEMHPSIPATNETVARGLQDRGTVVPPNVLLLSPKVRVTAYDLFPLATVGLVHTTTTGLEMVLKGIPVITTGRSPYRGFGFTLDPTTQDEYFAVLHSALRNPNAVGVADQVQLARKFALFMNHHYYTKTDLVHFVWGKRPTLNIRSFRELQRGRNQPWDYVVDSILEGQPILAETRWPPET